MGNNWETTGQSNEFSSKPVFYNETSTPPQTHEPSTLQSSPTNSNPDTTMSGSDSVSACRAIQYRRIPRLVFKLTSVTNVDGICSAKEKEEKGFNSDGNRVWTLETKEEAEKPNTSSVVVTELSGTESRFEPCGHDNTMVTEFKGKRKLDFDGVSPGRLFGVEGGEGLLNLQSGERSTVTRRMEGIDDLGDGNLVCEVKREGKDEEGERGLSNGSGEVDVEILEKETSGDNNGRTEEKGKGKFVEDDLVLLNAAINRVELVILDEEPIFYGNGSVKRRRRASTEEKGKDKV